MRTGSTLKPGARGTKKLCARYGDRLVCVRYRYDLQRRRRLKTVELIVDETDWEPRPEVQVFVRIAYGEEQARRRVKWHGARWHPERRLWSLPYGTAKRLRLEHRIVEEPRGVYTGGDG